jgi:recombination protein RecA
MAVEMDIIKKSGTWFSYGEEKIGQGKDKARTFLEENAEILKEVEALVLQKIQSAKEA